MIPFAILLEMLKQYDEVQLCELMDVSSEDLVDTFVERIKQRRKYISKELELLDPTEIDPEDLGEDEYEDE